MSGIKPPAVLTMDKPIGEEWRRWKRNWSDYCIIHAVDERPDNFQASLFRTAIRPEAMNILETQPAPVDANGRQLSTDLMPTVITMMDTFVLGQVNPTYERYLFRQRRQQPGERHS